MRSVPTNIEASLREAVEAWLNSNHAKLREIQQRAEIVKVRRKLMRVVAK